MFISVIVLGYCGISVALAYNAVKLWSRFSFEHVELSMNLVVTVRVLSVIVGYLMVYM